MCEFKWFNSKPYTFMDCRNANKIPLITYLKFTEGVKHPSSSCLKELSYILDRMNLNCFSGSCDSKFTYTFQYCGITKGSYKLEANYACITNGSLYSASNTTWVLPNTKQATVCSDRNEKLYFLSNSGYPGAGKPRGIRFVTVQAPDEVRPITVNVLSCRIPVYRSDENTSTICDERQIYQPQFEFTDTVTFIYDNKGSVFQGFLIQLEGTVITIS